MPPTLLSGAPHRPPLLAPTFRFSSFQPRPSSGSDDLRLRRSVPLARSRGFFSSPSSAARARALSTRRSLSLSLRLRCQLAVHLAGEKTRSNQLCISRSQTKSDTLYLIATFNAQISLLNKLLFSNCEYPLMQGCPVTFDQK